MRGNGLVSYNDGTDIGLYTYNLHGDVSQIIAYGQKSLAKYGFDAFGNENSAANTVHNPFGYCGEYRDEETGLIYLHARYYDPDAGRFISEDPAKDGTNWYVYCRNNPIMYVDPWGTEYVPLRETVENIGGVVSWDNNAKLAYVTWEGKTTVVTPNVFSSSYMSNGKIYTDDEWLFSMLAIKFEYKGWKVRIEADRSGGNNGKKHIHFNKGKDSYSQNDDGSPHDGSTGSPPQKIKDKIKENYGWDWDKKESDWINRIEVSNSNGAGERVVNYPNGRTVKVNVPIDYLMVGFSAEKLKKFYTGDTEITIYGYRSTSPLYMPIIDVPITIPVPAVNPVLAPI